ncbi:MAG: WecB/TagA/CpsF family glycosyltransferase [Spirochaetaceae bacterium]|jgi:N-acetylglucosaminyldiphosphoundecaprenol N-acetyl-beta-D-mannosaminyltransferase|nr:WecB/TagA/CpsF family glycosyltransferase [Spirochaetaceae bacterium]
MARERITLLKIPVDVVPQEDLETEIMAVLDRPQGNQIILLSLRDLLRARRNVEYRTIVNNAALVLPVSKSILSAASFLKLTRPVRYNPFYFIIQLLGILEAHYKSAYLFGTRKKNLLRAEKNVKTTFPGLQIVGRCVGYYQKTGEKNIISAIRKASPSLVLFTSGVPGRERWFYRNRSNFETGIFLWHPNVLDVFAERKKRTSQKLFDLGWEFLPELVKNPFKLFFIFPYVGYILILIYYRLFRTSKKTKITG